MPVPTSVTKKPCSCGFLAHAAKSALMPIRFDEELNEYSFENAALHGSIMIYHCPMCGGIASNSKRAGLFRRVSMKEYRRVDELTKHLKTLADIEATLGKPDQTFT